MSQKIPVRNVPPESKSAFSDLTASRPKIQPKLITGFYQNIRTLTMYSVFALFFLIPWIRWDGRQAILFDIPGRQFFIFDLVFKPEDMFFVGWLLIMAAFTLFTVTVFAGRVFCGYSCPQTIWVNLFMRVEKLFEGERHQRVRLDKAPLSANKILRRGGKHLVWLIISLFTALGFISYFAPVTELYGSWTTITLAGVAVPFPMLNSMEWFFTGFFTVATYMNAGWMREMVCFQVCPYGRFQSVMFDHDTLIVSYDRERGEPRGSRKRKKDKSADPAVATVATTPAVAVHQPLGVATTESRQQNLGDCIDCDLCVQVCPTGIDIRDGLQMECIQCAACLDACNSVMDRMNYPRGLVRYTTEREMIDHQKTHWLRPRLFGYGAALLLMLGVFSYTLANRLPLQFESIRDRNQLYRINSEGQAENAFLLKISNKTKKEQEYEITIASEHHLHLEKPHNRVVLDPGEVYQLPITVIGNPLDIHTGTVPLTFIIQSVDNPAIKAQVVNAFRAPSDQDRERSRHEGDER